MKEYNKCKDEIEFLSKYKKDKTIGEILSNLNQQLVYLSKTCSDEGGLKYQL